MRLTKKMNMDSICPEMVFTAMRRQQINIEEKMLTGSPSLRIYWGILATWNG